MIISHKYKFIFIKTRKTAGTSIEVFLSNHCGPEDVVTPIYPHVQSHAARNAGGWWNPFPEMMQSSMQQARAVARQWIMRRKFYNHMPARSVQFRVPDHVWNEYFTFCVERNPWDKTLSHYHMVNQRAGGNLSFNQYLDQGMFPLNYPQYMDANGRLMVDRVIRYESLSDELSDVFGSLGVPFEGELGVRAKAGHRKDTRSVHESYSSEQADIVAKAFDREIQLHGYSF